MILDLTPADWLARRTEPGAYRIGASEVAACLGMGGFADATPFGVWRRHHDPTWTPSTAAHLQRGHRLEPLILADYARGLDGAELVQTPHRIAVHHTYPWLSATPDGWVMRGGELVGLVEAKTDSEWKAGRAWPGDGDTVPSLDGHPSDVLPPIPAWYWIQNQIQMDCTRAPWVDLRVLLTQQTEIRTVRVMPSPQRVAVMLRRLDAWRTRHLVNGEPPEPADDDDRLALHLRTYGAPSGSVRATGAVEAQLCAALDLRRQADELERQAQAAAVALLPHLGSASRLWTERGAMVRRGRSVTLKPKDIPS